MRTLFGSLTDPAFVSERPDAAAAALVGTVTYVWAGAVLHVRPLLNLVCLAALLSTTVFCSMGFRFVGACPEPI